MKHKIRYDGRYVQKIVIDNKIFFKKYMTITIVFSSRDLQIEAKVEVKRNKTIERFLCNVDIFEDYLTLKSIKDSEFMFQIVEKDDLLYLLSWDISGSTLDKQHQNLMLYNRENQLLFIKK